MRKTMPLHSRKRAFIESTLGVVAHWIPATSVDMWRPAALATWSRARVSTALATFPLAREVVAVHVCAANIACGHAHVAATTVPCSALESFATAVVTLHVGRTMPLHSRERAFIECTLGVLADWIPATPVDMWRPAALAAWSCACVSTALATFPLAREVVAVHVYAANIACGHAHVAATTVPCSALESF